MTVFEGMDLAMPCVELCGGPCKDKQGRLAFINGHPQSIWKETGSSLKCKTRLECTHLRECLSDWSDDHV